MDQLIASREGDPVPSVAAQYLFQLYPNVSLERLEQVQDLLNTSSPNNIWSLMRRVQSVASGFHEALSKFDWNVFLPVASEREMEKLFGDYDQQEELNITYLVAGVVFDPDLPESPDTTFTNTTIIIRTNFSSVIDTSQYREK